MPNPNYATVKVSSKGWLELKFNQSERFLRKEQRRLLNFWVNIVFPELKEDLRKDSKLAEIMAEAK